MPKNMVKKYFHGMTEQERQEVLDKYHPDYQSDALKEIRIGPNKGEKMVNEVVDIMESYPRNNPDMFDLKKPDIETDVLIIGAGSAGLSAAIEATDQGSKVLLDNKTQAG